MNRRIQKDGKLFSISHADFLLYFIENVSSKHYFVLISMNLYFNKPFTLFSCTFFYNFFDY